MSVRHRRVARPVPGATLVALAFSTLPLAAASSYTGNVVNDDPREGRRIERLSIALDRLSTPEELAQLAGGGEVPAIGSARLDRTLAQDVIAAVEVDGADGKKLVLVFDGPFRWFDARSRPSARTHPHGVVELELDGAGKGRGRLLAGAKVEIAGSDVRVGEVAGEPMRVIQVAAG